MVGSHGRLESARRRWVPAAAGMPLVVRELAIPGGFTLLGLALPAVRCPGP